MSCSKAILVPLSRGDVGNLRQTNRALAARATQHLIHRHLPVKHVDITRSSLATFASMTRPGWLGCHVHHVVLAGVVYNRQYEGT